MSSKESFILYKTFYDPIKNMTDKQLGRLFRALFIYQLEGSAEVEPDITMAYKFFTNQFKVDDKKYQERCEQNRINAFKRWNATAYDRMQSDAIDAYNDNNNENGNENEKIMTMFNDLCDRMPSIKFLDDNRRKVMRARINEHGIDTIRDVFTRAANSNFLNGKGKNGWVANFDWVMDSKNFVRILEGNYDGQDISKTDWEKEKENGIN